MVVVMSGGKRHNNAVHIQTLSDNPACLVFKFVLASNSLQFKWENYSVSGRVGLIQI